MTPYAIIAYPTQREIIANTRKHLTAMINNILNTPNRNNPLYFVKTNAHADVMNGIIIIRLNSIIASYNKTHSGETKEQKDISAELTTKIRAELPLTWERSDSSDGNMQIKITEVNFVKGSRSYFKLDGTIEKPAALQAQPVAPQQVPQTPPQQTSQAAPQQAIIFETLPATAAKIGETLQKLLEANTLEEQLVAIGALKETTSQVVKIARDQVWNTAPVRILHTNIHQLRRAIVPQGWVPTLSKIRGIEGEIKDAMQQLQAATTPQTQRAAISALEPLASQAQQIACEASGLVLQIIKMTCEVQSSAQKTRAWVEEQQGLPDVQTTVPQTPTGQQQTESSSCTSQENLAPPPTQQHSTTAISNEVSDSISVANVSPVLTEDSSSTETESETETIKNDLKRKGDDLENPHAKKRFRVAPTTPIIQGNTNNFFPGNTNNSNRLPARQESAPQGRPLPALPPPLIFPLRRILPKAPVATTQPPTQTNSFISMDKSFGFHFGNYPFGN